MDVLTLWKGKLINALYCQKKYVVIKDKVEMIWLRIISKSDSYLSLIFLVFINIYLLKISDSNWGAYWKCSCHSERVFIQFECICQIINGVKD